MAGFFGIGHLPGEATRARAKRGLQNQAAMFNRWNTTYYEPALAALWNQYQNPETTWDKGQWNSAQGIMERQLGNSAQSLQQNLAQRGLGQSSITTGALSSLYNGYGNTLAQQYQAYQGMLQQRKQQALSSLMAGINPNAASGMYQQLGQLGAQEQAGFNNFIGGLVGTAAGNGWLNFGKAATPKPPSGPVQF